LTGRDASCGSVAARPALAASYFDGLIDGLPVGEAEVHGHLSDPLERVASWRALLVTEVGSPRGPDLRHQKQQS